MLEMGMTFSFGQLVIDDEIAAMVKRIVCGVGFDDELMGVDLIKEIGIGGHFLAQRHVMDHLATEQIQATIIDRRVREEAFTKFLDTYGAMKNTLAANMDANVKNHVFFAGARNHEGTLEAALHPDGVPPKVFHSLIGTVSENLDTIHRYTALKKKVTRYGFIQRSRRRSSDRFSTAPESSASNIE